jgi:hypothetical protein
MRYRGSMAVEERQERSRLAQLVHQEPFIRGSLVESTFKCGKDNCWCAKAEKGHPACYLSVRVGSKRKMVYVPKAQEKQIREWVKNHKEIIERITKVSRYCLSHFKRV